jgi:WD40 repeat protein
VAFSPDGRLLATACGDGTAQAWGAGHRSTDLHSQANNYERPVASVAFSPDGRLVATASSESDRTAKVWALVP